MDVRLDTRLITLGAALTAACGREPGSVHGYPLLRETLHEMTQYSEHPSVQWLWNAYRQAGSLSMSMQAVQMGPPPLFEPLPQDQVPVFVKEYFSSVAASEISPHLVRVWAETPVQEMLSAKDSQLAAAASRLSRAVQGARVEEFQRLFYGVFPYKAVVVPLNAPFRENGLGVTTLDETLALCLPKAFDDDDESLLILVQHEMSHPILDHIQRLHPGPSQQCMLVDERYPASGDFSRAYGDAGFRSTETLIRVSSVFYLEWLGKETRAAEFLGAQALYGVKGIRPCVERLRQWWNERLKGSAPGLSEFMPYLPGVLGLGAV